MSNLLETATFWAWFLAPGLIYTVERTIRIIRGSKETVLLKVTSSSPYRELQTNIRRCRASSGGK
jgi:hypothetical protein